jgi:hypothetical protein
MYIFVLPFEKIKKKNIFIQIFQKLIKKKFDNIFFFQKKTKQKFKKKNENFV